MLTLHYIPEDEWHGELRVEARYASFSGEASAWFNASDVRRFAMPLKQFLPSLEEPARLQGGFFSDSTTSSAPVETHIGISVGQHGSKGRYWLEARLAETDDEVLPQAATIRFPIEPAALLRFVGEVEAALEIGGSASLPASGGSEPDPAIVQAPCPIKRPYSPLLMTLREQCSALIERMDQEAADHIRLAEGNEATVSWQESPCHEIQAQISWDEACLQLAWLELDGDAWTESEPARADWSATYPLDLSALKQSAISTAHPRAWFESHALCILSIAQDHLIEFFRDGPTDDIPYRRHLIYAQGTVRNPGLVWVKDIVFPYDDRPS